MKALVLAARRPWPPRRGDQMRARDFVQGLGQLGYAVEVGCIDNDVNNAGPGAQLPQDVEFVSFRSRWTDRLGGLISWLGGSPLQSLVFRSKALEQYALSRLNHFGAGDVVVVQLARQSALLEAIVNALAARLVADRPLVLVDLIDTLSLNFRQRAKLDAAWKAWLWRSEARRLREAERRVTELADRVTLVCERDLRELARFAPLAGDRGAVLHLPIERGTPATSASLPAASEPVVALTGNLGYFVNHRAAHRFVSGVWPLVKRENRNARLVVAGARPRRALVALVEAAGESLIADPTDLRAILRSATVAVAPLSGGAGVPVKVLEAWAEGVPIVVSDWARDGVASSGNEATVPVVSMADEASPSEWAGAVVALLGDETRRAELREQGVRRVEARHSVATFKSSLAHLFSESPSSP